MQREFSSGGVVYKKISDPKTHLPQTLWLVRKTSKSDLYPNQYWMLPKGRIDDTKDDLPGPMSLGKIKADAGSLERSALREVREEGGIDAKIIKKIDTVFYSYTDPNKGKIMKFVTFFLMEYINDLPEGFDWETEEVKWLSFAEAYKTLSFGGEKQMLKKAKELLESL